MLLINYRERELSANFHPSLHEIFCSVNFHSLQTSIEFFFLRFDTGLTSESDILGFKQNCSLFLLLFLETWPYHKPMLASWRITENRTDFSSLGNDLYYSSLDLPTLALISRTIKITHSIKKNSQWLLFNTVRFGYGLLLNYTWWIECISLIPPWFIYLLV